MHLHQELGDALVQTLLDLHYLLVDQGVSTNCCTPGGDDGTGDAAAAPILASAAQLAATAAACGDTVADVEVILV